MTQSYRLFLIVLGWIAGLAGCGGGGSITGQLVRAQNSRTQATCDCFFSDRGYNSARECKDAETIIFLGGTGGCEGRAFRADGTGEVRANAECLVEALGTQAQCYSQAGCDQAAFTTCDAEAFTVLSACPTVSVEAQMAFNNELQRCVSGGLFNPPEIDVCPDDDIASDLGTPARTGNTDGSDNDLEGSCGGDTTPDEVIQWVAPQTGAVTIDTIGTNFDTVLYVLEGTCLGTELACNDDASGSAGFESEVTLNVTQGDTLLIVVDGFGFGDSGRFELNIQY